MGKKINRHLGFVGDLKGYGELYVKYSDKEAEHGWSEGCLYLGEWSKDSNKPHGRGIRICTSGPILIAYWNNGWSAPGKYIDIWGGGTFRVGECYMKDGKMTSRGTTYKNDGTTEKFDE